MDGSRYLVFCVTLRRPRSLSSTLPMTLSPSLSPLVISIKPGEFLSGSNRNFDRRDRR